MLKLKKTGYLAFLLMIPFVSVSQNLDANSYNENSVRPVRQADIMHAQSIWLRMDLRQKQNEPFFASNNEVSKIIIDAVKAGVLRPFTNDSLNQRMSMQVFLDNLRIPNLEGGIDEFPGMEEEIWDDGTETEGWDEPTDTEPLAEEFFAKQIYLLEIKEDLLIDRKHGKQIHDLQSIKIIIPGDLYPTGIEKVLGVFSYKELVENVFTDNPAALWYNPRNVGENRNLAEAFDLGLYDARIIKYSNPKDNLIEDIYIGNAKLGLAKSQEFEHKLAEYESNLWSN